MVQEIVQQQRLRGLTMISFAIIVGGIVFIALGIVILDIAAKVSESVVQDRLDNQTSRIKSMLAKTVTDALTPVIQSVTQVSKGIMTSMGAFLCLVGAGICVLGYALFKAKYLAWILTIVLMFVAIVIDVLGLGFVAGSFTNTSNDKSIMLSEIAYVLIIVMIVHLLANAVIIYYLTRKSTTSIFNLGLSKNV
ncbi:MAG: hypothetical protein ACRD93_03430 [Nitrososphaeraceae archaeon]